MGDGRDRTLTCTLQSSQPQEHIVKSRIINIWDITPQTQVTQKRERRASKQHNGARQQNTPTPQTPPKKGSGRDQTGKMKADPNHRGAVESERQTRRREGVAIGTKSTGLTS